MIKNRTAFNLILLAFPPHFQEKGGGAEEFDFQYAIDFIITQFTWTLIGKF